MKSDKRKKLSKQKKVIESLASFCTKTQRMLNERENYTSIKDKSDLKAREALLRNLELIINEKVTEDDNFILKNEVINGKSGTWYTEYFSLSTYYRHRAHAYDNFISCLTR